MIVKITGKLVALYNERAIIEYLPFEYETLIPEFTRRQLQSMLQQTISLYTIEYIDGNPTQGRLTPRLLGFLTEVEREFFPRAVGARRADDKAQTLGRIELFHHGAQLAAKVFVRYLARNADVLKMRHEDKITAGNADIRRERRALRTNPFFNHFDENFVALLEHVLNRRLNARSSEIAVVVASVVAAAVKMTAFVVAGRNKRRILLEIVRLDVADMKKTVAPDAEIDKRRLDALFNIDDDALVDIVDVVLVRRAFDLQLFQNAVFNYRDPAFFRLSRVNQHLLRHKRNLS